MYNWVAQESIISFVVLNVDGSSPSGHPPQIPVSQELTGIFNYRRIYLFLYKIHSFRAKIHWLYTVNDAGNTVSTETGTVSVTFSDDCSWTLTADTYITSLKGDVSCIIANGHRLFVGGKELKWIILSAACGNPVGWFLPPCGKDRYEIPPFLPFSLKKPVYKGIETREGKTLSLPSPSRFHL